MVIGYSLCSTKLNLVWVRQNNEIQIAAAWEWNSDSIHTELAKGRREMLSPLEKPARTWLENLRVKACLDSKDSRAARLEREGVLEN